MKEKKGFLKSDRIVTVATVAGLSLGLGASVALWKPLPYTAENIHNKSMSSFERVNEPYMENYGGDVQKAIQTLVKQNINMAEFDEELRSTVSSRLKVEAEQESKVIDKINKQKQEAGVQAMILTALTTTIGAGLGQSIGKGVSRTVSIANNAKHSIKNFSFFGRRKRKGSMEISDDDINQFDNDLMKDQENEIEM